MSGDETPDRHRGRSFRGDPRSRGATSDFPYEPFCRHFTGYRPCRFGRTCLGCPHFEPVGNDVLVINLDGMGDVLRSTAILEPLFRTVPDVRVTWVTRPRSVPLLSHHPRISKVVPLEPEPLLGLEGRIFDLVLNVDKSATACGLAARVQARERRGFVHHPGGAIVPANPGARYLFDTGLDDALKFQRNPHSEPRMLAEAFELPYARDPYRLHLRPEERTGPPRAVGFNTGCSPIFPHKKLSPQVLEEAVRLVHAQVGEPVLLLGGPEDTARNARLAEKLGACVETTPTREGVRVGAAHVARCEVVVTGDSLGLHLALALGCHVVVWFGVTCPQEIEVYDRGVRLLSHVDCAPCWKRQCRREGLCARRVRPTEIRDAVVEALDARRSGRPLDEVRGGDWWRPADPEEREDDD